MRSDMSKVITERPRWGHWMTSRKAGGRIALRDADNEYEDQPKRLPISWGSQSKTGGKDFSDLLGPLRRYLRRNVGRPWDKIFSELKMHLDDRSVTGRHVFQHIKHEVRQDCFIGKDGKVYNHSRRFREPALVYGFYVHPRTGLLRWKEGNYWKELRKKQREESRDTASIRIDETRWYKKENGIWYIAEYAECESRTGDGKPIIPSGGAYEERGRW